jgi:hypothetical protein
MPSRNCDTSMPQNAKSGDGTFIADAASIRWRELDNSRTFVSQFRAALSEAWAVGFSRHGEFLRDAANARGALGPPGYEP